MPRHFSNWSIFKLKTRAPQQYKSKTSFFYKILLSLGFILLIFYIVEQFVSIGNVSDHVLGIVLAFSILCIGGGFICYFLFYLFAKLANIADEIENMEEIEDIE